MGSVAQDQLNISAHKKKDVSSCVLLSSPIPRRIFLKTLFKKFISKLHIMHSHASETS